MNGLKLVGLTVLTMILLFPLKLLLTLIHPDSAPFTANVMVCLQLFLLGAIVFWLLIQVIGRFFQKKSIPLWKTTLGYAILLLLLEIGATYIFKNASPVSKNTKRYLVEYYMDYERMIPERSRECGRYDSSLIYTYKPNAQCLQENFEFVDSIYTNAAGLRDDDSSLHAPDIICLGDSYTMGWGVAQEKSFPKLIERATGKKILNAGISSYGTARETLLLNRLDTSNLKMIVIQFSYNDIAENNAYINNNYQLPVPPQRQYDSLVIYHKWNTIYFPYKRSLNLIRIISKDLLKQLRNPGYLKEQWRMYYDTSYVQAAAKSFVEILYRSGINFKKIKVLVVDVNRYPLFDHHFLEMAGKIVADSLYSDDFRKNLQFVETPELNDRKCFYELDNHLTPYGHEVLSKKIISQINAVR